MSSHRRSLLGLPLEDASTDYPSVLAPDGVGQPLQDRLRSAFDANDDPVRRLSMRSEIRQSNGTVHISIPPPGSSPVALFGLIVWIGIMFVVVHPLARFFKRTPPRLRYGGFPWFLILIFGVVPGIFVLHLW